MISEISFKIPLQVWNKIVEKELNFILGSEYINLMYLILVEHVNSKRSYEKYGLDRHYSSAYLIY